jgi:hypothetical protein
MLAAMADALWVLVLVAVCIGMLVAAKYIEPHWVSKDGTSFTCRIQAVSTDGRSGGRWVEARAKLLGDRVVLARRGLFRARATADEPRTVVGRATGAPARFAVYLVQGEGDMLALRVPAKSPVRARLDALAG